MKKSIVAAAVVAAALLAVGYFVLMPMMKAKPVAIEDEDEEVAAAPVKKKPKRTAEPGLTYTLPDRVLNLSGPSSALSYARIELVLEFERSSEHGAAKKEKKEEKAEGEAKGGPPPLDPELEPVAARKVMIDDLIIRVVGAKTREQISSPEGQEALKAEILEAVSELVPNPQVTAVYITRLIVQ